MFSKVFFTSLMIGVLSVNALTTAGSDSTWLKREPYRGRSKTLQSMHKREPGSDIDSTWARREPIRPIPTYKPIRIKPKREPLAPIPWWLDGARKPMAKREPLMALPTYLSNPRSTPRPKREPYPEPDWDEVHTLFQREPEPEPWGEDIEEL